MIKTNNKKKNEVLNEIPIDVSMKVFCPSRSCKIKVHKCLNCNWLREQNHHVICCSYLCPKIFTAAIIEKEKERS